MKSMEEIKSYLESAEGGTEYYESVVALVEAEKNKGISSSKKLKGDIQTYSKYKTAFESLGFDGSVELDEFAASLVEKLQKGNGTDSELAKLRNDLKRATKAQEDFEKKLGEERTKRHSSVLRDALTKGFLDENGQPKIYGADLLANTLISNGQVKLLDDEKTVVFIENDDEIPFSDGISKILETRKDLVRNSQKGGTGSKPIGDKRIKTMKRTEFDSLTPSEKFTAIREGTKITE